MNTIDLIIRSCCECDRPEKYDVDTVELRVSDLRGILESHLVAAPPAPVAAGWIRVEDRLPVLPDDHEDDGRPVWTWDGQFVAEDEFVPTYEQPAGPTVGGWVRTGEWFASDTPSRVTHWMPRVAPLPPSPEAEVSHD